MRVIHVLRKPCSESTVTANVLKHGTGGFNIDASRVSTDDNLNGGAYAENPTERWDGAENWRYKRGEQGNAGEYRQPSGRWPANVILQHLDGCRCDGVKKVPSNGNFPAQQKTASWKMSSKGKALTPDRTYREGGKETVADWICEPGCPVARLDDQSGEIPTQKRRTNPDADSKTAISMWGEWKSKKQKNGPEYLGDSGGASRFYKQVGGGKVSE